MLPSLGCCSLLPGPRHGHLLQADPRPAAPVPPPPGHAGGSQAGHGPGGGLEICRKKSPVCSVILLQMGGVSDAIQYLNDLDEFYSAQVRPR